jgi:predicted HicB family RNase H-like nuclease
MPVVVRPWGEQPMLARNGLQLPQRLPFERWLHIGSQLSALSASAAWCLGDWLVFGEQAYAGRYRQAIEQTSLDYQTLRNYAWVARRFSLSRRRDKLSFGHHCEVAALAEPEQDFWLRKAEEHHWPVKQLRREVRASLKERSAGNHEQATEGDGQHDWVLLKLQIRLSPGQLEACQVAADKASLSVQDWAARVLQYASDPATGLIGEQLRYAGNRP